MAALVAEGCDHQVGGAVENLWPIQKVRRGIDKTAEANHPRHLVEVAEGGFHLRQKVDGAAARGRGTLLNHHAGAKLALGDQLAVRAEANLAGYKQQIPAAHEG